MQSPTQADFITKLRQPRTTTFLLAKRCLQTAFALCALPRLGVMRLMRMIMGDEAFRLASESIARIPGMRGVLARQAFYRWTISHCGQDVHFGWLSVVSMPQASVGNRAYIGRFCSIGFAEIGEEVMLADHVQILSGGREHGPANPGETMHMQPQIYHRVRIGNGAWIGAGAIVMADVGISAIVGAGAVVTKPIPAHCIAIGVPARVVKQVAAYGSSLPGPRRCVVPQSSPSIG
ncbi:MAG: acyltransferase [Pirellulaceae bacterium]|jgi:acetyltransferase-like isoleucine patch superfamily enzyme|nr:acyltransferase [Pirellulaceae bacterium]